MRVRKRTEQLSRANHRLREEIAERKEGFYELDLSTLKLLIIDFREVVYIGSACIGKLLLFYKELFDREGCIRITGVSPPIHEMLQVVKLDGIIEVTPA